MKKVLILVVILVIPSVAYLILHTGKNNFKKLEILGPKEPVQKTVDGKTVMDTVYHTVGGFSLIGADGQTTTDAVAKDKISVVDFFFTTCTTICPRMSNNMMKVQYEYRTDPDVISLSFSVDPDTDTPTALSAYAKQHKATPGKWYFLTGDKKQIYDLARNSYFVTAMAGDGGPDDFIHSEQFVLIDKEKRIRGFYDGTDVMEIKRLNEDIRMLQFEYSNASEIK
ncbi:SCO family protein [soil metagenome]